MRNLLGNMTYLSLRVSNIRENPKGLEILSRTFLKAGSKKSLLLTSNTIHIRQHKVQNINSRLETYTRLLGDNGYVLISLGSKTHQQQLLHPRGKPVGKRSIIDPSVSSVHPSWLLSVPALHHEKSYPRRTSSSAARFNAIGRQATPIHRVPRYHEAFHRPSLKAKRYGGKRREVKVKCQSGIQPPPSPLIVPCVVGTGPKRGKTSNVAMSCEKTFIGSKAHHLFPFFFSSLAQPI